jgi:hypothetical protein
MPRVCTVCHHLRRKEVDRDLLAGMPLRTIADHWSVSKTALIRHKTDHLASALVKAKDAEEVAHADGLPGQLKQLTADARRIQEKAERAKDYRVASAGVRKLVRIVDLVARLTGELQERNEMNILNVHLDPETAKQVAETYLARHPPDGRQREPCPSPPVPGPQGHWEHHEVPGRVRLPGYRGSASRFDEALLIYGQGWRRL